jgi:RNA polymerase sigma-70 factor, ECF subfamily
MGGFGRGERAWVRGAQAGSVSDLESLFRAHWPLAYRAALLIVHDAAAAEDIAQEAFLAAVRSLDRFDSRRPFGPWLHRIAVNRAIDWARARTLRAEVGAALDSGLLAVDEASDGRRGVLSDDTARALRGLSPEHRAVIVLRYVLDYTPGEIAKLLELPRGTVNSRLRRGLDELQNRLPERAG